MRNVGGTPIRVSDLGRVEDSFAEPRTWNMLEGKQAVTLEVRRQSGTNTVKIIDTIKEKLAQIDKTLPPGVATRVIRDQSVFINASIASLEEHLFFGSVLASLIVFLFIRNVRSVIIASLAIPTSIIATFTLLKVMDFTLNNMTLLALTLAVGIVIDDAIVVLENIVRYIHEKRYEPTRGRHRSHQGDHAGGAGHHPLAGHHLPAHRVHERLRPPLREPVRLDDGVLHPGLHAGELHPHADAQLAAAPASARRVRASGGEGVALLRLGRRPLRPHPPLVAGPPEGGRVMALGTFLLVFPLNYLVGRDWIPPDDQGELNAILNLPEGSSGGIQSRPTSAFRGKASRKAPKQAPITVRR